MFAFRFWSSFGSFRDPITITQTLSMPIPPKTAVGGILAAIIGLNYNDYFNDTEYFDFKYSIVTKKEIAKKTFIQNYIEDYTKKSFSKINSMNKYISLQKEICRLEVNSEIENFKKKVDDLQKKSSAESEKIVKKYPKAKPINRELLLRPEYLVFVENYKYEDKVIEYLKNHHSEYNLYMGNTEFSANYEFLEISIAKIQSRMIDSFTTHSDKICFELGKKYTPIYAATKVVNNREYRDFKKIILCNNTIKLNTDIDVYKITQGNKIYNCEFI